jgi:hypothetical protein
MYHRSNGNSRVELSVPPFRPNYVRRRSIYIEHDFFMSCYLNKKYFRYKKASLIDKVLLRDLFSPKRATLL